MSVDYWCHVSSHFILIAASNCSNTITYFALFFSGEWFYVSIPVCVLWYFRYAKLRVAQAPGMPETFAPTPRVSDIDMHHGTCVTHVPWCMPGSITNDFLWSRWREKRPGIPGACASRNFRYLVRGSLLCHLKHVWNKMTKVMHNLHWLNWRPYRLGVECIENDVLGKHPSIKMFTANLTLLVNWGHVVCNKNWATEMGFQSYLMIVLISRN